MWQLWRGPFSFFLNGIGCLGKIRALRERRGQQVIRKVSIAVGPRAGLGAARGSLQGERLSRFALRWTHSAGPSCHSGDAGLSGDKPDL